MKTGLVLRSVAACAFASCTAHAAIVSVGADLVQIAQPADATLDTLVSAPNIFAWNESQDYTLGVPVFVEAQASGFYGNNSDLVHVAIPSGTIVNSHYFHFDAFGTAGAMGHGLVTFDSPIIGVICQNGPTLRDIDNSDFLGAPTLFTSNEDARGLEMSVNSDHFTISPDHMSLDFNMGISIPGDYIRVLTRSSAPTPGALGLLAIGGLTSRRRRR